MTERLGIQNIRTEGAVPMPFFGFRSGDDERMNRFTEVFYRETFDQGLYLPDRHIWFISLSHSDEDIASTLEIFEDALKFAKQAI